MGYPWERLVFPGMLPAEVWHLSPLHGRPSDDHFMQIMCIRKGKRLVARILPFLSPEQAADVLMATARNLPFLIKKDAQDEVRFQGLGGFPSLTVSRGVRHGVWSRISSPSLGKMANSIMYLKDGYFCLSWETARGLGRFQEP